MSNILSDRERETVLSLISKRIAKAETQILRTDEDTPVDIEYHDLCQAFYKIGGVPYVAKTTAA